MSPDIYPSDDFFEKTLSRLSYSDQITIREYLRGKVGEAGGAMFWKMLICGAAGFLLGRFA